MSIGSRATRISSRLARGLALAGLAWTLAACSTTGRSFDTSTMSRIVPGQTTLEQASRILAAEPEHVYRQLDGSALAGWTHKASLVTDAVYFRRELWLRFDNTGRFQHVVDRVNVHGETGQAAEPVSLTEPVAASLPRAVPADFPYGPDFGDGPVAVYPVR